MTNSAWSMEEVKEVALRAESAWGFSTWNPVTGCTKTSPGCDNCYAERIALRLREDGNARYANGFDVTLHADILTRPMRWRKPRVVFTCSMSDLFHAEVPDAYLHRVFETMNAAHWHVFHVLTKRPRRVARMASSFRWSSNIWMGTTVESADYVWRVDYLRRAPASVRFLSLEPLLGPIADLPLDGVDWVLVGGESGPRARPIRADWVRQIRDQCRASGVNFLFKQWGGTGVSKGGRVLDGRVWDEMPPLPATAAEVQLTAF